MGKVIGGFLAGLLVGALVSALAIEAHTAREASLYDGPPLSGQQCATALMDARQSHAADLEQCNMIAQVYVQYVETSKEAATVCAQLIQERKQCPNTQ